MQTEEKKLLTSLLNFRRINWNDLIVSGLTLPHIVVLLNLVEYSKANSNKPIIMSELSKISKMTRPALTQVVNLLEKEYLVLRTISKTNRRMVYIEATEAGKKKACEEWEKIIKFFNKVTYIMGEEDTRKFIELLDKFYAIINTNILDKE